MTEQQIIALIEENLPQDLAPEQLRVLRGMIKTSPAVREALLAELCVEQGLATRMAPLPPSFDQAVQDLLLRAQQRRRARWTRWVGIALLLTAGAGTGLGLWAYWNRSPAGGAQARATAPAAAATQADGQPDAGIALAGTDRTGQGDHSPVGTGSGPPTATAPGNGNDAHDIDDSPPPLWRLFDNAPWRDLRRVDKSEPHVQLLSRVLKPLAGASLRQSDTFAEARGTWQLIPALEPGRMLRLAGHDWRDLKVDLWSGKQGLRFDLSRDGRSVRLLRVWRNNDRDLAAAQTQLLGDDGGAWSLLRQGPLDLHLLEGRVLLCRGEKVLLGAALTPGPAPTQVLITGEGRLRWAGVLRSPLNPPAPPPAAAVAVPMPRPAQLDWRPPGAKAVSLARHEDGSVSLLADGAVSNSEAAAAGAWFPLPVAYQASVTLALRPATGPAALTVTHPRLRGDLVLYVVEHRGQHVLASRPADASHNEQQWQVGNTLGTEFQLRVDFGLNHVAAWVSHDGQVWRLVEEEAYDEKAPPVDRPASVGLAMPPGTGKRRIDVTAAALATHPGLTALGAAGVADGAVLARRAATLQELAEAASWPEFLEVVGRTADKAPPVAWRRACAAAVLNMHAGGKVKRAAALDLLESAMAAGVETASVLAGLRTLAGLGAHRADPLPVGQVNQCFDRLAERAVAADRMGELDDLWRAWLGLDLRGLSGAGERAACVPPGLLAMRLHAGLDAPDADVLRTEALRCLHLHRDDREKVGVEGRDRWPVDLAEYALALAMSRLPGRDGAAALLPRQWLHPLALGASRDTLNQFAEFEAAVRTGAYEHACRVLTRAGFAAGVVPVGAQDTLYQDSAYRVRQVVESTPEMASLLRDRFAELGLIRVRRALAEEDLASLAAATWQFHGTPAAALAAVSLADRELAGGQFVSAAGRYRQLLAQGSLEAAPRQALNAKLRLASAMFGQPEGPPVETEVVLPGGRYAPAQFEQMIRDLVAARRGQAEQVLDAGPAPLAPGPPANPQGRAVLRTPALLQAMPEARAVEAREQIGLAADGRFLVAVQRGKVEVFDLPGGTRRLAHERRFRDGGGGPSAPRPLLAGHRLFVRLFTGRTQELHALDLERKQVLWQRTLDDEVVSDPAAVGPWLYVATRRNLSLQEAALRLHRLSPATGESVLSADLVVLPRDPRWWWADQPVAAGDSLLFRAGPTLICCNLLGQVRWVRKLPFLPVDHDRERHAHQAASPILLSGHRALLTSPSSAHIQCLDVSSGEQAWAALRPSVMRLIGVEGSVLVAAHRDYLEGLDIATGRSLWTAPLLAAPDAVLPARGGHVLALTPASADQVRPAALRWLRASDGAATAMAILPRDAALADPRKLVSDGRWVWAVANYDRRKASHTLVSVQAED